MQIGQSSAGFMPGLPALDRVGDAAKGGAAPAAPPAHPGPAPTDVPRAPQAAATARSAGATELMRTRTLEDAVNLLSDQGRLPPRGSLVDLSA